MHKGQVLYAVNISIEEHEEEDTIAKTSCEIDKCIITSIQKRRYHLEKHVYIGKEIRYSAKNTEIFPRETIPVSRWDLNKHKHYSTTEVGAIKKALKRLPALVKRSKEFRDSKDDEEYYQQYMDCYNGTIKKTLNRMISNREKKIAKRKERHANA